MRLLPHLDAPRVALTGGVAMVWHLQSAACRGAGAQRAVEDLDLVAEAVDAVRPTVAADFLVSHFHLPQPGYAKFLVQLVDPVSRLRVDVFPDALGVVSRARAGEVAGVPVRILDPRALLEHKLALLARSSTSAPVAEKHVRDAELLAALCDRPVPDLTATALGESTYSQDVAAVCLRCVGSADRRFPLAPKRQIHDLLGYV